MKKNSVLSVKFCRTTGTSGSVAEIRSWLLWQWTLETSMAIVFNSTLSIEINCRFKPTMDKRAE